MKKPISFTLNKILTGALLIYSIDTVKAQCVTTNIAGDFNISSNTILSGTYNVAGTFKVAASATVYVKAFASGNCGKLVINAQKIIIDGVIDGNYSGNTGGSGGFGGNAVTSLTGDLTAINTCSNKDNTGVVMVEGGKFGTNGSGAGFGMQGQNGQTGSGPKQQCLSSADEAGMIGSAGGAGGGGGAAYGGLGTVAALGGNGANSYTVSGVNVSTGYVVVGGSGGAGGGNGAVYGTSTGTDIAMGSSGAGGGGGGRSFDVGLSGGKGGNGGGMVQLISTDSIKIAGKIMVNGENGANGGDAGNGGSSPNCCSDGCDDSGEATASCGAGAGSGGGGGSGGGIYIETQSKAIITGTLQSNGGNGGNTGVKGNGTTLTYNGGFFCGNQTIVSGNGNNGNKGGAAGGGRIKIFVPSCSGSVITPSYSLTGGSGFANAAVGSYQIICGVTNVAQTVKDQFYLTVFPNPSSDNITLKFKYDESPQIVSEINIVNTLGLTVAVHPSDQLKLNNQTELNLSQLAAGIYFIKLKINTINYDYKVIKQ